MSYDLMVYLKRTQMPKAGEWNSALTAAGFTVALDHDFDAFSFTGFLPALVDGERSGFEYNADEASSEELTENELPTDLDFAVQFCMGSRPLEMKAALAASSVLAFVCGGFLVDPQEGDVIAAGDAIEWATTQLVDWQA